MAVGGTYADGGSISEGACGLLVGACDCCTGGVRRALPWALPWALLPPGTLGTWFEGCILGEFGDEVAPTMAEAGTCAHELSSLAAAPSADFVTVFAVT